MEAKDSIIEELASNRLRGLPGFPGLINENGDDIGENRVLVHEVARWGSCTLLESVLDANMSARLFRDSNDRYPLHYAARFGTIDSVDLLIKREPSAVKMQDKFNMLPLHYACMRRDEAAGGIVSKLLLKFPQAVDVRNNNGQYPLHLATHRSTLAVVHLLYQHGGQYIFRFDSLKALPVHYCADRDDVDEAVAIAEYILGVAVSCLQYPDQNGQLPLHRAIKSTNANSHLILALAKGFPEGFEAPDKDNLYPIHLAARNPNAWKFVSDLMKYFPSESRRSSRYGLPLHVAAAAQQSFDVIQALVWANPRACATKCACERIGSSRHHGVMYPDDLFSNSTSNSSVVFIRLIRHCFAPDPDKETNLAHVHVCGDAYAGKTVFFHWLNELLGESSKIQIPLPFRSPEHAVDIDNRTRGVQTTKKNHGTGKSEIVHCHDYGGQFEYLVNHATALSEPNSIYVLLIPLWHPVAKQLLDREFIKERMLFWLKYLFSLCQARFDSNVERNNEQQVYVPVVLVINTFNQSWSDRAKHDLEKYLHSSILETFGESCAFAATKEEFASPKPYSPSNCQQDVTNDPQSNRCPGPVLLISPVIFGKVRKKNGCKPIVDMIRSAVPLASANNFQAMKAFCDVTRLSNKKVLPMDQLIESLEAVIKATLENQCAADIQQLREWSGDEELFHKIIGFVRRTTIQQKALMGEIVIIPSRYSQQRDLCLTDPDWARSVLLGDVIFFLKHRPPLEEHGGPSHTHAEVSYTQLATALNTTSIPGDLAVELCTLLGLCVRTMTTLMKDYYLFFSLLENCHYPLEQINSGGQATSGYRRSIARVFYLEDARQVIIPGYFFPLFNAIYCFHPATDRLKTQFFVDGMVMSCRSVDGRFVQYIIRPEVRLDGSKTGFRVQIDTDGYPASFAITQLDHIRSIIFTSSWNVDLCEFAVDGQCGELKPMQDVEDDWFCNDFARSKCVSWMFGSGDVNEQDAFGYEIMLSMPVARVNAAVIVHERPSSIATDYSDDVIRLPDSLPYDLAKVLMTSEVDNEEVFIRLETINTLRDKMRASNNRRRLARASLTSLSKCCSEVLRQKRFLQGINSDVDVIGEEKDEIGSPSANLAPSVTASAVTTSPAVGEALQIEICRPASSSLSPYSTGQSFTPERAHQSDNTLPFGTIGMMNTIPMTAKDRYFYDEQQGLHAFPLFPVFLHNGASRTILDRLRKIIGKQYRVRFLCPVCCTPSSAGSDGEGYKMFVVGKMPMYAMRTFQFSMNALQLVVNAGGVPARFGEAVERGINAVLKKGISQPLQAFMEDVQQLTENLEIPNSFTQELTDILTTTTSDDVAHIPSVFHGENERGRSTYINTNVHSDSRAASTSSPPPPPSSASSSSSPLPRTPGLPTNQELVVGPTYISYLRQLMTGLGDPTAAHSGLIPVTHISSGAHAWVCRGTIHEESICARTFCAEGASCFALKYGRMCI